MLGDATVQVRETGVDLVRIVVPPTVPFWIEATGGSANDGQRPLLHLGLELCRTSHGVGPGDRRKHLEANRTPQTQRPAIGVLPDEVSPRDDDGKEGAVEAPGKAKRAGAEGRLDAENRSLREDRQAFSPREHRWCRPHQ